MNRSEAGEVLSVFGAAYERFRPADPAATLEQWARALAHVPAAVGMRLAESWVQAEPHPPSISEFLHQWHILRRLEAAGPRTEAEAVALAESFLADEERAKLAPPPTERTGRELARESIASMRAMIDGSRRPQSRADLIAYHLRKQGPHAPGACYGGLCRSLGIDLSEVPA